MLPLLLFSCVDVKSFIACVCVCAQVNLEVLSYQELKELLQLVTIVPFDSIDQQLHHLQCQTKRWYHRFLR